MSLRQNIIDYLSNSREGIGGYHPTWWFKFHVEGADTPTIRRELEKMERDGIVNADRRQRNNTKWKLEQQP